MFKSKCLTIVLATLFSLVCGFYFIGCARQEAASKPCEPVVKPEPWPNTDECNSGGDRDLTACVGRLEEAHRKELNQLYQKLELTIGSEYAEPLQHLKEERIAWEDYAKKACELDSDDVYMGTAKSTHYAECMNNMVQQHILDVKRLIDNFENRS